MMTTVPSPANYATHADFMAAYNAYRRQVDADRDAALLAQLADLGARTTDCDHGYTAFDSCPVCD
jgi:hypothetical protein